MVKFMDRGGYVSIMVELFSWFKKKTCKHRFAYEDLEQTGIPDMPTPKGRGYQEWADYYSEYWKLEHEGHTKRVRWPCAKCGKVFYAHCGLDIISGNNVFWREHENKDKETNTK